FARILFRLVKDDEGTGCLRFLAHELARHIRFKSYPVYEGFRRYVAQHAVRHAQYDDFAFRHPLLEVNVGMRLLRKDIAQATIAEVTVETIKDRISLRA